MVKRSITKILYSGCSFNKYNGDAMAASIPVVNVEADEVATCPFGTEF